MLHGTSLFAEATSKNFLISHKKLSNEYKMDET
jgi:hypothetical protein